MPTSPTWCFPVSNGPGSRPALRRHTTRPVRCVLGIAVAALQLLRSTPSGADEPLRIVVVSSDPDSTRARRVAAELRSLGLTVVSVSVGSDASPELVLPGLARTQQAIAAVQVVTLPSKEQVWVADRVTNKTVLRELPRNVQRPDQTDDSIAVGVAELLRASLMEIHSESRSRGEYAATEPVRKLAYPTPSRTTAEAASSVWAAARAGVQPGLRGAGNAWLVRGSVSWRAGMGLGVEALVAATVSPSSVRGAAGTAQLSNQWLGLGADLTWPASSEPWRGHVGIAIVGNRLIARGEQALSPWVAATETAYSPGVYFHGGPAFGYGRYQLGLDFGVLVLSSPATIHLAEQRAAVWGAPVFHVTLGVASRVWP